LPGGELVEGSRDAEVLTEGIERFSPPTNFWKRYRSELAGSAAIKRDQARDRPAFGGRAPGEPGPIHPADGQGGLRHLREDEVKRGRQRAGLFRVDQSPNHSSEAAGRARGGATAALAAKISG
jgi:hypothetical protein